jgi:hypothetical protein
VLADLVASAGLDSKRILASTWKCGQGMTKKENKYLKKCDFFYIYLISNQNLQLFYKLMC